MDKLDHLNGEVQGPLILQRCGLPASTSTTSSRMSEAPPCPVYYADHAADGGTPSGFRIFCSGEHPYRRARALCSNPASAATPGPRSPIPGSEVIARPRRRSFTAEYRRSILDQADAAHDAGAVGLLLRRDGLYYSDATSASVIIENWAFTYDTLNRLVAGTDSSTIGTYKGDTLCWAFDAFGNRTTKAMLTSARSSSLTPNFSFNSSNQIQSALYHYDAAGNVLADGQNQYLYDAEGRLCAVAFGNSGDMIHIHANFGWSVAELSVVGLRPEREVRSCWVQQVWVLKPGRPRTAAQQSFFCGCFRGRGQFPPHPKRSIEARFPSAFDQVVNCGSPSMVKPTGSIRNCPQRQFVVSGFNHSDECFSIAILIIWLRVRTPTSRKSSRITALIAHAEACNSHAISLIASPSRMPLSVAPAGSAVPRVF